MHVQSERPRTVLCRKGSGLTWSFNPTIRWTIWSGLEALTSIGGYLSVQNNARLATLRLETLESLGQSLTIELNPRLPACEAEWLRDHIAEFDERDSASVVDNGGETDDECP
jgi:hypothetical protein